MLTRCRARILEQEHIAYTEAIARVMSGEYVKSRAADMYGSDS